MDITDAELDRLAEFDSRLGAGRHHYDPDWPEDGPISMPWRGGDDPNHHDPRTEPWRASRRKITLERCNAIREAAHDGKTPSDIAGLFTFVGARSTAHDHATGSCVHGDGDMPPVSVSESPPGGGGRVSWVECDSMRARYSSGATCQEAGAEFGYSESCAYRHIAGKCNHERSDRK